MDYTLDDYGGMIADDVRMGAYLAALRKHVAPDSVVLDIGCGFGIFAMLACQLGARKVIAIDPNPAVEVGRKLAQANGFQDRIEFHQKRSQDVEPNEKADILVSDLRGVLPIYGQHFEIIEDARERLLKPNAIQLPQCDRIHAAVASAAKDARRLLTPWQNDYGFNLSAVRDRLSSRWSACSLKAKQIVTEPQVWTELDYTGQLPKHISNQCTWTITKSRAAHGVYLWFDCDVCDGIGYSASPFAAKRPNVYGSAFMPWPRRLMLREGDELSTTIAVHADRGDQVFSWQTTLTRKGRIIAQFNQCSLDSHEASLRDLHRRAHSHVPTLSEDGRIDLAILQGMNESQHLADIAQSLAQSYPKRFSTWQEAMGRVGDFSINYGESE